MEVQQHSVAHAIILALGRQSQEDCESEGSLVDVVVIGRSE